MGSQNMIDSSYLKPANIKAGAAVEGSQHQDHRRDCDGARGGLRDGLIHRDRREVGAGLELVTDPEVDPVPMQLLPSGPGYLTMPNLRLFTGLLQRAQQKLSLTSPACTNSPALIGNASPSWQST